MPRGIQRERQVIRLLEKDGWWAKRMPGSFGTFDVIAIRPIWQFPQIKLIWLIEVKSTKNSPYQGFGPAKRDALYKEARRINAEPLLCWWPPNGEPEFIRAKDWPQ